MRRLIPLLAFLFSASFLSAADTAQVKIADGFELPVGSNGKKYFRARGMTPNGHLGEDWDGVGGGDTDLGDPVTAIAHGVVLFARDFRLGWGNVVILRHAYMEAGVLTYADSLYGHLNEILVGEGTQVTRGQKIGTIGNNHGMYSAHLHFEMRKNLRIGMARSAFPRDYANYWDPSAFVAMHPKLEGGGRIASVPINTFVNYTGPADLEAAIAQAGGAPPRPSPPRSSPLRPSSPAQPSPSPTGQPSASFPVSDPIAASTAPAPTPQPKPKPGGTFRVDPFADMRGMRY